jgi:hypothetical protein
MVEVRIVAPSIAQVFVAVDDHPRLLERPAWQEASAQGQSIIGREFDWLTFVAGAQAKRQEWRRRQKMAADHRRVFARDVNDEDGNHSGGDTQPDRQKRKHAL